MHRGRASSSGKARQSRPKPSQRKPTHTQQRHITTSHQQRTLKNKSTLSTSSSPVQLHPTSVYNTPSRFMGQAASKKQTKGAKVAKKVSGPPDLDGEDPLANAGDVKKRVKTWLEQILTSKPRPVPLPEPALLDEDQFVKECQSRFALRLHERSRYEQAKINLKQRAIGALPSELQKAALVEDPTLWPMLILPPATHPPRKRWVMEHFGIPYRPSIEELEEEDAIKKKYARF